MLALNFIYIFYLKNLRHFPSRTAKEEKYPEKRPILIRALSAPYRFSHKEYLEELKKTSCAALIDNSKELKVIKNLAPLFMAINYHYSSNGSCLKKVYILVSKELSDNPPPPYSSDINKEIRKNIKEKIEHKFSNLYIYFVEEEEGFSFEDFHKFREKISKFMESILRMYDSKCITIDIMGGTSIVSAGLILSAIKRNIQAQYLSQKDNKTFYRINTNVLDIEDLVEEFLEKFKELFSIH